MKARSDRAENLLRPAIVRGGKNGKYFNFLLQRIVLNLHLNVTSLNGPTYSVAQNKTKQNSNLFCNKTQPAQIVPISTAAKSR